jgi:hypothetical protein
MSAAPIAPSHAHAPRQRKPLTAVAIEKLGPRAYRYEIGDPGARALRVIVQPSGHKSFVLRYRFGGKPQKLTVGPVLIGLAAARQEAAKAVYELAQGRDPAAGKRAIKEEQRLAALAVEDTFHSVAERFLKLEASKLRSGDLLRKTLERLVHNVLGARPIADIKRSEIVRLLDQIEEDRGPVAARVRMIFAARSSEECRASA